jgi:hypothetical protein
LHSTHAAAPLTETSQDVTLLESNFGAGLTALAYQSNAEAADTTL